MTEPVNVQPPTLKGGWLGGHVGSFRKDPLGLFQALQRECGDVARFRLGPMKGYLLSHPDAVQNVLVTHHRQFQKGYALQRAKRLLGEGLLTSEGAFHTRQRRLAQPAFHRQRIAQYADVMVSDALRIGARWSDGEVLDIHQEMSRLTLSIVGRTLFNSDVEGEADAIGSALTDAMAMFERLSVPFSELIEKLPLPSNRRFDQARARLDETIFRMIRERREAGDDQGDLLSMLLRATDDEGDGTGMSDAQLRDELLTIFLAGHETTANAMAWTWYLLGQHPEVRAKVEAEIELVLEGRLPTVADLAGLKYLEMVLAESMRLYPPAWTIGRRALTDYPIGDYVLPKGSIIVCSQFIVHRDARWFPEPERFDPLRFLPEARTQRPKFAYFPFGGGPRVCLGEPFAWMEGVLILATIAQRWRLHVVPEHPVEMQPLITLRPRYGIQVRLEARA